MLIELVDPLALSFPPTLAGMVGSPGSLPPPSNRASSSLPFKSAIKLPEATPGAWAMVKLLLPSNLGCSQYPLMLASLLKIPTQARGNGPGGTKCPPIRNAVPL